MKSSTIFALITASFASPGGAPGCGISADKITAGMGAQKTDLGYTSSIKRTAANSFEVSFANTAGRADYQGLLMFVASAADPKTHVGKFTFANPAKWKYQDAAKCSGVKGALEATVTHSAPAPAAITVKFTLELTDAEMAMPDLDLQAVIASTDAGKPTWQILPSFPVSKRSSGGTGTTGTTGTTGGTPPAGTDPAPSGTGYITPYTAALFGLAIIPWL
jgi:hypothetical protein